MILDYSHLKEGIKAYRAGRINLAQLYRLAPDVSVKMPEYGFYVSLEDELSLLVWRNEDSPADDPYVSELLTEVEEHIAIWQPDQMLNLEGGTVPVVELRPVLPGRYQVLNAELIGIQDHIVGVYLDLRGMPLRIPLWRHSLPESFVSTLTPLLSLWPAAEMIATNDFSEELRIESLTPGDCLTLFYDEFGEYQSTPLFLIGDQGGF